MANKSAKLEIQVDAETKSAVKDLDKITDAVADISTAAADASESLDKISAGAADAASSASEAFGGIVPVFDVAEVLGAVTDLAVKAGEAFSEKLSDAMSFEAGQDKLQAQLGATAEEAEHLGQLAGDLYSEAFGESMEQVNDVMRRVIQNLGVGALDPALRDLTSGVLDIIGTFETDAQKTTQALGNIVKTGLVRDGLEGLDLMVRGFQKGADNADDFLDTLIEFSTDFRQAGLTGAEAVGLMIQSLKKGGRDTDKLADSLAEWRKLGVSGAKGVADAYKELGIDVREISRDIGAGGERSAAALKRTFDAIRNLPDPGDRLRLVAATFGTPAEDLAKAFTDIDLTHAVEELGKVGGAAKELSATVASNADATWTAFRRSIETNVIQFLADNVVPAFTNLGIHAQGVLASLGAAWDAFTAGFRGEAPLELGIDDGKLQSSISAVEGAQATENPTLKTLRELGEEARKFSDEWTPKVIQALKDLQTEFEKLAKWVRENQETMKLLAEIAAVILGAALIVLAIAAGLAAAGLALITIAIGVLMAPILFLTGLLHQLDKTWLDVWSAMLRVISWIGGQIGDVIETLENVIEDFIGLLDKLRQNPLDWANDFQLPGVPRSVAPSVAPMGLLGPAAFAGPASMGRPAPVFNVTIAHSGLAVDSPRLQREIVDALRRYEKREGPLRGLGR